MLFLFNCKKVDLCPGNLARMIKFNLVLFAFLLNISVFAQNHPEISFSETSYDFGLVKEEEGPVDHTFLFVNKGKQPLVITGVTASCGCTTTGWSEDAIPAGKLGFVKAQYNPLNRPGAFKKSLTVTTNGDPNIVTLYIEGFVKAKPRSIVDEFPAKLGAIRVKYASLHMGNVKNNAVASRSFEVYNDSEQPLEFSKDVQSPSHVAVSFSPEVLQPHARGNIIVSFDPKDSELGFATEDIVIQTSGSEGVSQQKMRVVAVVEEYFPPMTADQLAKAAAISIDKSVHEFGSVKSGSKVSATFTISNSGKEDLLIRSVKSNCDCVTASVEKTQLDRNDRTVVNAVFDTTGRQGSQVKTITIFTNDPKQPMKVVRITGKVD